MFLNFIEFLEHSRKINKTQKGIRKYFLAQLNKKLQGVSAFRQLDSRTLSLSSW